MLIWANAHHFIVPNHLTKLLNNFWSQRVVTHSCICNWFAIPTSNVSTKLFQRACQLAIFRFLWITNNHLWVISSNNITCMCKLSKCKYMCNLQLQQSLQQQLETAAFFLQLPLRQYALAFFWAVVHQSNLQTVAVYVAHLAQIHLNAVQMQNAFIHNQSIKKVWQTVFPTHTFSNLHARHYRTLAASSSAYPPVLLTRCTSWTQWSNLCIQTRAHYQDTCVYLMWGDQGTLHECCQITFHIPRLHGPLFLANFACRPSQDQWNELCTPSDHVYHKRSLARMCGNSTYLYNAINWLHPHSSTEDTSGQSYSPDPSSRGQKCLGSRLHEQCLFRMSTVLQWAKTVKREALGRSS